MATAETMQPTDPAMKAKQFEDDSAVKAQVHRIRITLTSRNVKNLEKGAYSQHSPVFCSAVNLRAWLVLQAVRLLQLLLKSS